MSLEAVSYISDLVATNPVGATDPKSQGDDHIRNLKTGIKATFPNLTGAMNATQAELNRLVGVTGVTGTGSVVLSASPTFTGTVTADTVAATTLTGAGSGITALNASALASGTVPDARFPSTLPALNGSLLTALNATNIASGSVPDARLGNAALKNASNTFTASQVVSNSAQARLQLVDPDTSKTLTLGNDNGSTYLQVDDGFDFYMGGSVRINISSGGNFDFKAGTVTTNNASAAEVGYKGAPPSTFAGSGEFASTDAGRTIIYTGTGGGHTITLPNTGTLPVNSTVVIINNGDASVSIAATGGIYLAGTTFGTSGTRTLARGGMMFATMYAADNWLVSGAGLS